MPRSLVLLFSRHAVYFFAVFLLAVYFCAYLLSSQRSARQSTRSLVLYFAIIAIWSAGWVAYLSWLDPRAAYSVHVHSIFVLAPVFWLRFAYAYPFRMRSVEARWLPRIFLLIALLDYAWTLAEMHAFPVVFHSEWGVYRLQGQSAATAVSGILQLLGIACSLVVFVRRARSARLSGAVTRARSLRYFAWISAAQLSLVVAYVAYLQGLLGVSSYRFLLSMGCIGIALFAFDAYFNNAAIPSTLRARLSSIMLALLAFLTCGLFYFLSPDYERASAQRISDRFASTPLAFWRDGNERTLPDYARRAADGRLLFGDARQLLPPRLPCAQQYCYVSADWNDPRQIYLAGAVACPSHCAPDDRRCRPELCEAGLRYVDLREEYEHRPAMRFIVALLLAAAAALLITPAFFQRGLLSPLMRLLEGVRRVDRGDLGVHIAVSARDEIGRVTGSFNGMVHSVREARSQLQGYAARLEEMVQEKTRELQDALEGIRRDMNLARKIQEQTLPAPVSDPGIQFAVRYHPQAEVGGDLYDICKIGPDRYRLFLADATGHGVRAALITMAIKGEYESLKRSEQSPEALLAALNENYRQKFAALGAFFTCVLADIDLKQRQLNFLSAGHPTQLLLRGEQTIALEKTGIIVGVSSDAAYGARQYPLQPGDRLLLFSDGLFEQFNAARELFGEQRVARSAAALAAVDLERMVDALLEQVRSFAGSAPREDDVAILAAELLRDVA
ncbi:MAG: SpoIIE family protein phosphatase [Leptospirales bacterium]|nr:SpoIIE family protein phosphatase [Leptospirales bacterium]